MKHFCSTISKSLIPILGTLLSTALALTSIADAQTCEALFKKAVAFTLVEPSWLPLFEKEYQEMKKQFGVDPVATTTSAASSDQVGLDQLLYQHWKMNPETDGQLLNLGFKRVDPSPERPGETGRFVFPNTMADYFEAVQTAQGDKPTFKLSTYNKDVTYALAEKAPADVQIETSSDVPFKTLMKEISKGSLPHGISSRSLVFFHDAARVADLTENPEIFPAWQEFAKSYVSEKWERQAYYKLRADVFMEVSYILKPEKYASVDSYIISKGFALDFLGTGMRARSIMKSLKTDMTATLAKVKTLTDAFDDLFSRHGGAARDFFSIDSHMLTPEVIETYVRAMKASPNNGSYQVASLRGAHIDAIESLEGIKRQIQFVADALAANPKDEPTKAYLSYRVAQFETAMLQQRKLEYTQVDLIKDSMLPMGAKSKTFQYFKSFQPRGSRHSEIFVGR